MKEKYLPIGTICKLSTSQKEVMIIGYLPAPNNEKDKVYDYSACTYPEGLLSSELIIGFNHDEISEIINIGLESESYKKYNDIIKNELIKENNNSENIQAYSIETLGI